MTKKNKKDSFLEGSKPVPDLKGETQGLYFFEVILPLGLLILGVLFVVLVRINLLGIPFERDEGIYQYFGQLVLEGKKPYLDFYEMKPPGIYYSYALLNWIFGSSVERAHAAFLFLNILTIFFLYLIGKKILDNLCGAMVAVSFGILSLGPQVSGFTTQSEHLITFFSSAGLLILVMYFENPKRFFPFFAGVLFGFSLMIKQSAIFFVLFSIIFMVFYFIFKKPIQWKIFISYFLAYFMGLGSIIGAAFLLVWFQGSFGEFLYWVIEFPKTYVSYVPFLNGVQNFKYFGQRVIDGYLLVWMIGLMGLFLMGFSKLEGHKKYLIGFYAFFSFLTIFPGFRFYGHYWLQFIPSLSLLVGVAIFSFKQLTTVKGNRAVSNLIVIGIFMLVLIPVFVKEKDYYFSPDYNKILRDVYDVNPFPEAKVIGDYIKERTNEKDQIALIGSEPQIYYYTNRKAPSKHAYFSFLVKGNPRSFRMQKEFIKDVEKAKPKFLVFFDHPLSLFTEANADLTVFQWVKGFTKNYYQIVGIADFIAPNKTHYVWNEKVSQYIPKGKLRIVVFKRK